MSGFGRKFSRQKQIGKALGQLTEAAKQAANLNEALQVFPQLVEKANETSKVLDSLLEDYQTLADELEVTQYILRRTTLLTPDQEAGYRSDYQKMKQDSG
jgi:DNA repair ATPase RecN